MTKKAKIILIISVVVAVLAIAVAGVLIWFFSPGVHLLFGYAHIDTSETGYVMNEKGEILGESTFTAKGTAKPGSETANGSGSFSIEISGFPAVTEDDNAAAAIITDRSDGIWQAAVSKSLFSLDPQTGESQYGRAARYVIYIDQSSSSILTCCVHGMQDREGAFYFVRIDDPSEAFDYITQVLQQAY